MTGPRQLADRPLDCAAVELLLAEIAERTLSPAMAERVHRHTAGCAACKGMLVQASQGRDWLLVLKQETLDTPVDLVAKIMVRTSYGDGVDSHLSISDREERVGARKTVFGETTGDGAPLGAASGIGAIAWQRNSVVVLRRTLLDPRLALVAAMAFFSISLTLNMLGLRFSGLHASDLQPKNLHRTITRQVADTNARVVRYYENLRVVYEVEAQVQQMRRAAESSMPPPQVVRPRNQSSNSSGPFRHRRTGSNPARLAVNPKAAGSGRAQSLAHPRPKPVYAGHSLDAAFHPFDRPSTAVRGNSFRGNGDTLSASLLPVSTISSAHQVPLCSPRHAYFFMLHFSTRERRLA